MRVTGIVLSALAATVAYGTGFPYPTASDPCGTTSDYSRFIINTTAQQDLMSQCTIINHTLWIGNNFPGPFSLPKLLQVGGIYVGDALYEDPTGGIVDGSLTSVSLPALEDAEEIIVVDYGSITSLDLPSLRSNSGTFTLAGLPALRNFTFGGSYEGSYVNITNTGLNEILYNSGIQTLGFTMSLINNQDLSAITFSSNASIGTLELNCNSAPLPAFTGPPMIDDLEISFCNQPSVNWEIALQGVGTISGGSIEVHDNTFTGFALPNTADLGLELNIHDNAKLTNISFPAMFTMGSLSIKNNSALEYIASTDWPNLGVILGNAELSGSFVSIDLPPYLLSAPSVTIQSTESDFDCSKYSNPTYPIPGIVEVTVDCTGGNSNSSSNGNNGGDGSGTGSGTGGGDGSNGSDSEDGSNSGPVSSNKGNPLSTGAIAGIAVAGASFIISLLITAWLCIRRRNRRRGNEAELRGMQPEVDDLAGGPPMQQYTTEAHYFSPSQVASGGEDAGFVADHGVVPGAMSLASPVLPLSQPRAELEGKEIYEILSPVAVIPTASEMPSEKSNLFYNRYAVAERQSREEALAARERAVEARERQLETLATQQHDRFEL